MVMTVTMSIWMTHIPYLSQTSPCSLHSEVHNTGALLDIHSFVSELLDTDLMSNGAKRYPVLRSGPVTTVLDLVDRLEHIEVAVCDPHVLLAVCAAVPQVALADVAY